MTDTQFGALRSARIEALFRVYLQHFEDPNPVTQPEMHRRMLAAATILSAQEGSVTEPTYESLIEDAVRRILFVRPYAAGGAVVMGPTETSQPDLPRNWLEPSAEWPDGGYWRRYRTWLAGTRSADRLQSLDQITNQILGHSGSPAWSADKWDRRGVVVGQVQSGKTETYIGVLAKAIDAGYKSIVVLAGIHNDLRAQTQLRVDEGLVGVTLLDDAHFAHTPLGVGLLEPPYLRRAQPSIDVMTGGRKDGDFNAAVANRWTDPSRTHIFVIKKTVRVLERINAYFAKRPEARNGSLFLLDDESDQASVNVRDADDPTKTNAQIRMLLEQFPRSSYVGMTATPFANIFIDPEAQQTTLGADLFPKDFIIRLKPSSDYFGPERLFGINADVVTDDDRAETPLLVAADDWESWMRQGHSRKFTPGPLPESLLQAMADFVVGAAIKRIRHGLPGRVDFDKEVGPHATMLVHVTRYVDVQQKVADQLLDESRRLHSDLIGGANGPTSWTTRLRHAHERLTSGRDAVLEQLDADQESWALGKIVDFPEALQQIRSMTSELEVAVVNGTVEDGLRYRTSDHRFVIAVGGDKLSRGLTLEGLTVSYFLRTAGTWDTLLQMGRWFGYRPRYLDLCRVYMPDGLSLAYEQVTRATVDLAEQFDRMSAAGASPLDFGLRLQRVAAGLLPTRKGAMAGVVVAIEPHHSQTLLERLLLPTAGSALDRSLDAVSSLYAACAEQSELQRIGVDGKPGNIPIFMSIPHGVVCEYIRAAGIEPSLLEEPNNELGRYIEAQAKEGRLVEWTVAFMGIGSSPDLRPLLQLGPLELVPAIRKTNPVGGPRQPMRRLKHLSSVADESLGLSQSQCEQAKSASRIGGDRALRAEYRAVRRPEHGLLLCYPVVEENPTSSTAISVTWAISFPIIPGEVRTEYFITPAEVRRRAGILDETNGGKID